MMLMRNYALSCHYEEAIEYARRILALDPLRENIQQDLMRLFILDGQQAAALRQFEKCRHHLCNELDVAPMPQTTKLFELIRSGRVFDELKLEKQKLIGCVTT